jgi:protoheme ferro-lyase
MTTEQAREVFNAMIASTADADKKANLELVREYLTNAAFRKAMSDKVREINNGK